MHTRSRGGAIRTIAVALRPMVFTTAWTNRHKIGVANWLVVVVAAAVVMCLA